MEGRKSSHKQFAPANPKPAPFSITVATIHELTHVMVTQSPLFASEFTHGVVHSMGFDKCIMT